MQLIIVESPTKAKTFSRLVNEKDFCIVSSMGHIADLPKKKIGITITDNDVEIDYAILPGKNTLLASLIKQAKNADSIVLATDPDREGEAISFHLRRLIEEKVQSVPFKRIVFHEITKEALENALKSPGTVNMELVNAQQSRRAIDRLVGYKISPYLWKRFSKRWLSAGRVQTVALRFVVERDKEREAFLRREYFSINGTFKGKEKSSPFDAPLFMLRGTTFYTTHKQNLFDGSYSFRESSITNEKTVLAEKKRLENETYTVSEITETIISKTPPPPFTTSALQQYASTHFGYSAKKTMRVAQRLYENGWISYHRTDSIVLSQTFIQKAREHVIKHYGKEYVTPNERVYKTATKNAQEAHEAIRPTELSRVPESVSGEIPADEARIYQAIYNRALATQMADAKVKKQRIVIESAAHDAFSTERFHVLFKGFLALLPEENEDSSLLSLTQGSTISCASIVTERKETQPPPRYTEASLIKTLEKKGIGRPSTYAPIVTLIQERQYVKKEERNLCSTELGSKMVEVLIPEFTQVFDVAFTAQMEEYLDKVAAGQERWQNQVILINTSIEKQLAEAKDVTEKVRVEEETDEVCPKCGKKLVIKLSRFGKFYACTGFPECTHTKSYAQATDVVCPECKTGMMVMRFSKKKRRFYGCNRYPDCKYTTLWLKNKTKDEETSSDDK